MLISLNWLKDYINLSNIKDQEIGSNLTLKTVELEELHSLSYFLDNVVIAKVVKLKKHPNADRLKLAFVSDGKTEYKIVCGGTNLYENMLVALAKEGAEVCWHGEKEVTTLRPTKIRGEESQGMICAGSEIKLSFLDQGEFDIADLSFTKAKLGTPLKQLIQEEDTLLEIDNKSMNHRPDLWGFYGIARELTAIFNKPLKPLKFLSVPIKKPTKDTLEISISSSKVCPRYSAVILENISIKPSPLWMQARLSSVGIKPINNIVDITNYVMLEMGQPLHAFDSSKVSKKIIVRLARDKEKLITLDGTTRSLSKNDIVISDNDKAIALGGVMGGQNTEIQENTSSVIIESANFNPVLIRRTANKYNLRTEAAQRFEKHQDPENTTKALKRALQLIKEIIPESEISSPIIDEKKITYKPIEIRLDLDFVRSRIGLDLSKKEVMKILKSLEFEVEDQISYLKVTVPSFRATKDISIPEDLIEEIARIYGYDNISGVNPQVELNIPSKNVTRKLSRITKSILADLGFSEVYNYSFLGEKDLLKSHLKEEDHIKITNSISSDYTLLRNSSIASLLKNIQSNLRFFQEIRIFEYGRIYQKQKTGDFLSDKKKERLFKETKFFSAGILNPNSKEPFFELKEILTSLFGRFNLNPEFSLKEKTLNYEHPQKTAQITIDKKVIGKIFEVNPEILLGYKIKKPVALFEINFDKLTEFLIMPAPKFQEFPKFQNITVDISIEIDKDRPINFSKIKNIILKNSKLIESITPKDIPFIKNKTQVYTLELSYRFQDRQITSKDYASDHKKVITALEKNASISVQGSSQIISTLDKLITQ